MAQSVHDLAGQPAPPELLENIPRLVTAYFARGPDVEDPAERVSFGTSGHRGSSLDGSFNEDHIAAIAQAICDYRAAEGVSGPLYVGMDTHALSEPARTTAVEVFTANQVTVVLPEDLGYTPTPAVSHAILTYNRDGPAALADGVVITPSHNPPRDGGFKYNGTHGGPASGAVTGRIEERANQLLAGGLEDVARMPYRRALEQPNVHREDLVQPYVSDLDSVLEMDAIASAGLELGVDPMGGSGIGYWEPIAEAYGLDVTVVNDRVDPTFSFMTVDGDGVIRMDCSSSYAMAGLIQLKDRFDVAFGNDTDYDRHGIVTRSAGLLNPNHYLSAAVWYLFQHRPNWDRDLAVGKTLVSTSMLDRIAQALDRPVAEVPVGFKWFVDGLHAGRYGFGGEESAGASFVRKDGTVWTTDKDGIIMDLLAAEITAVTGADPSEHYENLQERFGSPAYRRIDAPATREQKEVLRQLSPDMIDREDLAGEAIERTFTRAPANDASIGGLKVVTENGWFAARPSGTEDIYKIYGESFAGESHLDRILEEAQEIVQQAFESAGLTA